MDAMSAVITVGKNAAEAVLAQEVQPVETGFLVWTQITNKTLRHGGRLDAFERFQAFALAMELGVTAVLMNTAIAEAKDAPRMARAMKLAVEAGRASFLAGRMPRRA